MNLESLASAKSFVAGGFTHSYCRSQALWIGGRDFHMTGYTLVIICTPLEYVGEENVSVFVVFLHFNWNNMPVVWAFAVYFLKSPLNQFMKSMEVVVQDCRKDSCKETFISTGKKKQCEYYDFLFKCTSLIVVNKRNYFWVFLSSNITIWILSKYSL